MEEKFVHSTDGQELEQIDVNMIASEAALADDRTLAELLRLAPLNGSTVAKAIVPFGQKDDVHATVERSGSADGKVRIRPFRAIIGSRTAVATSAVDAWHDIRSGIYAAATSTNLYGELSFVANASGNARWDLVYASIAVEADGAVITRYVKDPSTGVVTAPSVARTKVNTVTVTKVTGTASATPAAPALPADGGGVYNIPLAYVRIPNGYTAASTIGVQDILSIEPIVQMSRVTGAMSFQPANYQNLVGGTTLTTTRFATWGSSGTRPGYIIPAGMGGMEGIVVYIDLTSASSANWSHQNAGIVDNSRDWRNRFFFIMVSTASYAQAPSNGALGSDRAGSGFNNGLPVGGSKESGTGDLSVLCMGQSFVNGGASNFIAQVGPTTQPVAMPASSGTNLYVNSSGAIILDLASTASRCGHVFYIFATAPFPNF